jgi:hypothetical protein
MIYQWRASAPVDDDGIVDSDPRNEEETDYIGVLFDNNPQLERMIFCFGPDDSQIIFSRSNDRTDVDRLADAFQRMNESDDDPPPRPQPAAKRRP